MWGDLKESPLYRIVVEVLVMKSLDAYKEAVVAGEFGTEKKAFRNLLGLLLLCIFTAVLLILIANMLNLPMILDLVIIAIGVVMFSAFSDISSESKAGFKILGVIKWLWLPELVAIGYILMRFYN